MSRVETEPQPIGNELQTLRNDINDTRFDIRELWNSNFFDEPFYIVYYRNDWGYAEQVECPSFYFVLLNKDIKRRDRWGNHLGHYAAISKSLRLLDTICDCVHDLSKITGEMGWNLFHTLVYFLPKEQVIHRLKYTIDDVIRKFQENGCDPSVQTSDGDNCFHLVAARDDLDTALEILRSLKSEHTKGNTPNKKNLLPIEVLLLKRRPLEEVKEHISLILKKTGFDDVKTIKKTLTRVGKKLAGDYKKYINGVLNNTTTESDQEEIIVLVDSDDDD